MTKRTTLYMETTEIPPERTAAEMRVELVKAGAQRIAEEYGPARDIVAIMFSVYVRGVEVVFRLPIRVEPIFRALNGRRKSWDQKANAIKDREQAKRVAWRIALRWLQAQVAMIQTDMVAVEEVFLPYAVMGEKTVYEIVSERGFKALPEPEQEARVSVDSVEVVHDHA